MSPNFDPDKFMASRATDKPAAVANFDPDSFMASRGKDSGPGYLSQVGTGLWNTVKGMANVAAEAGGAAVDPINAVEHLKALKKLVLDPQVDQAIQAHDKWKAGDHSEAVGHALASILPGVGPAAANIGDKLGSGDVKGAAADATVLGATMAAPHVAGPVAEVARGAADAVPVGRMASAVKAGMKAGGADVAAGAGKAALGAAAAEVLPGGPLKYVVGAHPVYKGVSQVGRGLSKGGRAAVADFKASGAPVEAVPEPPVPAEAPTPEPPPEVIGAHTPTPPVSNGAPLRPPLASMTREQIGKMTRAEIVAASQIPAPAPAAPIAPAPAVPIQAAPVAAPAALPAETMPPAATEMPPAPPPARTLAQTEAAMAQKAPPPTEAAGRSGFNPDGTPKSPQMRAMERINTNTGNKAQRWADIFRGQGMSADDVGNMTTADLETITAELRKKGAIGPKESAPKTSLDQVKALLKKNPPEKTQSAAPAPVAAPEIEGIGAHLTPKQRAIALQLKAAMEEPEAVRQ